MDRRASARGDGWLRFPGFMSEYARRILFAGVDSAYPRFAPARSNV